MTQSIFFWFLHSSPEQCNLIFRLLVANENHGDVKLDYSCCWFMLCLDETRLERIRLLWCVDLKDVLAPQFLQNNLSEKIQTEKRPILNSKNDSKYLQIFPFIRYKICKVVSVHFCSGRHLKIERNKTSIG